MDLEFLLDGDPAIRWQALRDLAGSPRAEWASERMRVQTEGWGARMLGHCRPDGQWPEGRWTSTVWVLPLLIDMGYGAEDARLQGAFGALASKLMPLGLEPDPALLKTRMDLCHLGFWLRIGSYFSPTDPRLRPLAETVLSMQFPDGGWNCRLRTDPKTTHSSFHTTLNVLEGLRQADLAGVVGHADFLEAEAKAAEFLLLHRLYRSDKTGAVISPRFLDLTYPSYWHYNVLRGLDYLRLTPAIHDARLQDPIDDVLSRRKANGRWPTGRRIPGLTHFDMEKMGGDSRWNTLRALRVLKARESS